jgi:hypothetical protein
MSYSFVARGATVAAVVADATAKLDEVIVAQPLHAAERDATVAAFDAFANLVGDARYTKVVQLSVSGSIMVDNGAPTVVSMSVLASFVEAMPGENDGPPKDHPIR